MPKLVAVAPTYATGDLARILEIEQCQIEDTVADLTEEQLRWRPNPKAKSALDILWHLAFPETRRPMPENKAEALAGLRDGYDTLQRLIATPGKLDEMIEWHTGDKIPYRGAMWAAIRHRTYHLGELVYLRQAISLDEPRYYHE